MTRAILCARNTPGPEEATLRIGRHRLQPRRGGQRPLILRQPLGLSWNTRCRSSCPPFLGIMNGSSQYPTSSPSTEHGRLYTLLLDVDPFHCTVYRQDERCSLPFCAAMLFWKAQAANSASLDSWVVGTPSPVPQERPTASAFTRMLRAQEETRAVLGCTPFHACALPVARLSSPPARSLSTPYPSASSGRCPLAAVK